MSRIQEQARDTLKRFLHEDKQHQGEVLAVDENAYTCDVELPGGLVLYDVQLKALREAENGIVAIPAIGSTVQMISVGDPDWLVICADAVTKVVWIVDGTKLEVQKDLFQINGGSNGGMVIVNELVQNLNSIKSYLDYLVTAIQTGLSSAAAADTSAGTVFKANMQAQHLNFKNMENPKITH